MTMQHRAISIGHITFDTHTFLFMTLSLSLDFSLSLALFSLLIKFVCFVRAYRHRAYQWKNFRTAADASGDDINTHIVLFITSGFLFILRNLRCTNRYIFV